jgi:hypothetical protein
MDWKQRAHFWSLKSLASLTRSLLGSFLSFLPKISLIAVEAVELWVTRSVIQAPVRQPVGLSIRCGKSISPEKPASYDTRELLLYRYEERFNI